MTHAYLPPGRVMRFGDCDDAEIPLSFFPTVAQSSGDGVLQWMYLNYPAGDSPRRDLVGELLAFDGRVEPVNPEGVLPRGRAFEAHGKLVSSRSNWSPRPEQSVSIAYGKAGREGHGANDVGQFCLDGYGRELIVTLGMPAGGYPADYFGSNREKYYNASTWGQNLFTFDRREQVKRRSGAPVVGAFTYTAFDDGKGAAWQIDLTPVYEGARKVRRTVVHLLPDVVVVLDEASLESPADISMRWHTADRAEPTPQGQFRVASGEARLAARIVPLHGAKPDFRRGQHAYEEPFHLNRTGAPLNQPRESFVETAIHADRLSMLTLFHVQRAEAPEATWQRAGEQWQIETPEGTVTVTLTEGELRVTNRKTGQEWKVPR